MDAYDRFADLGIPSECEDCGRTAKETGSLGGHIDPDNNEWWYLCRACSDKRGKCTCGTNGYGEHHPFCPRHRDWRGDECPTRGHDMSDGVCLRCGLVVATAYSS